MSRKTIHQAAISDAAEAVQLARKNLRKIQNDLMQKNESGSFSILIAMDNLDRIIKDLDSAYTGAGE